MRTARILTQRGFNVILTRSDDRDCSLDKRTTLANSLHGSLFVSIHANSSCTLTTRGIETFYATHENFLASLEPTLDNTLSMTALRYHTTTSKNSKALAENIHSSIFKMANGMTTTVDRGVKKAASQVLVGANMPAALVELGFLTHPEEARLLGDTHFQQKLAEGITQGIVQYCSLP